MTSVSCPRCGAAASGHFCSNCGSSLAALTCPSCAAPLAPGARFCTQCGTSLTGDPAGGSRALGTAVAAAGSPDGSLAWAITGVSVFALIAMIGWQVIRPEQPAAGTPAAPGAPGSPPDLSTMTPIEAADRLFERVMTAVETGDEGTVQRFLPMALQAYEIARPLNSDGLYHLATLQRAGGDFQSSAATAAEGLATAPDHLLLLAAAGEAAEGVGDAGAARAHWQRFLDVYDTERARQLEEYQGHEFVLEESRTHAREVVAP
jgi:hypothetical protein